MILGQRVTVGWLAVLVVVVLAVAVKVNGLATPNPGATTHLSMVPSPTPGFPTILVTPATEPGSSPTPSATPSTVASTLDGVLAPTDLATRLPLAIMIDDNVHARPQSGFNAASIVYQAPADGGEDRYMALFQEADASSLGAVRSGRPYFVRWAAEYRAAFGHYGGDYMTLGQTIPQLNGSFIFNVDALHGAGSAYHRVSYRKAPYNAYTDTATLRRVALRLGAPSNVPEGMATRLFVDDAPRDARPTSSSIVVPYNRGASSYTYDPAANAYLRSVAGEPQVDAADGERVTARNVIVLFMRLSIDPHSEPGYHRVVLDQIGSGSALVFREGRVWEATWRKDSVGDLTRLFDDAGNEIPLVRGRTFFQVVPTGTKVTYDAESATAIRPSPGPLATPAPSP